MSNTITDILKQASSDLRCASESSYPFTPFHWKVQEKLNSEIILQKTGRPSSCVVEVISLDKFFRRATTEQDWHNEQERAEVRQYQNLVETLLTHLHDIQVYRIGEVEIDVYIVGRTVSGDLAGLHTKVVET